MAQGGIPSIQDSMGCAQKGTVINMLQHVKDMSLIIEINIKYTKNHWNGQRASDHRESRPHY